MRMSCTYRMTQNEACGLPKLGSPEAEPEARICMRVYIREHSRQKRSEGSGRAGAGGGPIPQGAGTWDKGGDVWYPHTAWRLATAAGGPAGGVRPLLHSHSCALGTPVDSGHQESALPPGGSQVGTTCAQRRPWGQSQESTRVDRGCLTPHRA